MLPLARRQLQQTWSAFGRPTRWFQPQQFVRFAAHRPLCLPDLDKKWQVKWAESTAKAPIPEADGKTLKPKSYVLPMFPYPSGNLHMGHFRVYTISDVLSRFKRMQGYKVLHPMGWDAFGLPAENAAIERGVDPAIWTDTNIANMKTQLRSMNSKFDWNREIRTCDPDFFKHTQQLFLMLHERRLAYQAEALVNYDPIDRTVLANEQVDSNGYSWRSGAKVEKQLRKQWFLRITAFKEALLDDLKTLSQGNRWPARIISMQQNWLGRSEGAKIRFPLACKKQSIAADTIPVFTTRPDTLHGVQYLALSITHPLTTALASQQPDLQAFVTSAPSLPADSKAGFLLSGITALNPLSRLSKPGDYGDYDHEIPLYVASYVLDYGEKAVMGVPGHDNRDFAFWKANCDSQNVRKVVEPTDNPQCGEADAQMGVQVFEDEGILSSSCGDYAGLSSEEASKHIVSDLDGLAEEAQSWRLRDWLISRQRYWGTPIPIVHCPICGPQPVHEEQLPVKLPVMSRDGQSGIVAENDTEWLHTQCPACGGPAIRETDTMDTFMDSSWYFMRFINPKNTKTLVSNKAADKYLPVDIYVGGIEHAILHLLYARFISKFLATTEVWPSGGGEANLGEPFHRVISQGMVHGKTFTDPQTGRFLKPKDLDFCDPTDPKIVATGESPSVSWEKMSKSKHNGVDPVSCISRYGADVTRAHMIFQAPVSQVLEWDEERIVGVERWFIRIWRYLEKPQEAAAFEISRLHKGYQELLRPDRKEQDDWALLEEQLKKRMTSDSNSFKEHEINAWIQVQKTVRSVTTSFSETFALNTVVSDLMELSNVLLAPIRLRASWQMEYQAWNTFLRMLAPVAPAFAEECWERIHAICPPLATPKTSIFDERWPKEDGSLDILESRGQTCSVQENGKFRFTVDIERPPEQLHEYADLEGLKAWAVEQIEGTEAGKKFLKGKMFEAMHVARKGKTVNFVTPKPSKIEDRPHRDGAWD